MTEAQRRKSPVGSVEPHVGPAGPRRLTTRLLVLVATAVALGAATAGPAGANVNNIDAWVGGRALITCGTGDDQMTLRPSPTDGLWAAGR